MKNARAAFCLLVLAVVQAACSDSSGPDERQPTSLAVVSGADQTGRVAQALPGPLVVRVSDGGGRPVSGVAVSFTVTGGGGSVAPATATTGADGEAQAQWTLGTRVADNQSARASITTAAGARNVAFQATPAAGSATRVAVYAGNTQNRPPGAALRDSLAAVVTDEHENPISGVTVSWSVSAGGGSISPPSSSTDAAGVARALWTLGPDLGAHAAQATVPNLGSASFTATAVAGPTISAITPDPLLPGGIATITGSNFSADAADNAVDFGGALAQVLQASATQLTVRVPCVISGAVNVTVSTNGVATQAVHNLAADNPLSLSVGQSQLLPAGEVCRELTAGGRYVLAVVNGNTGTGATSFRLRGAGPAAAPAIDAARPVTHTAARAHLFDLPELKQQRAHQRMLEQNLELVRRLGVPTRSLRPQPGAAAAGLAAAQIAVNDTLTVKIPNANGNLCSTQATVRARVVFAGARGVILEDINAPLAGRTDSLFRALGDEFETVQWPILVANFGNPLAYDAQTDGNGRVYMLFSKVINDFGGLAGFVSSGNFYPAAQCASSNLAEIFYGVVPTDSVGGYGNGTANTRENWNRTVRSLLIHEVKHITAFAERFARNGATLPNLEESWLEESTAVMAEELFARTVFGYQQNQNTGFQQSLFCERRPNNATYPECRHMPFIMYGYYAYLYDYLAGIETLTPTGSAGADDYSFYGSGWFLIRWAADQFATDEGAFLRALVQDGGRRGVANLEARTGRTFTELLADWVLAIALDDRPGLTGVQPLHTIPSWNTRDVFARINQELPAGFPTEFPLAPRPLAFGTFSVEVPSLRAGTVSLFELAGGASGQQVLHLTAAFGLGAPDPALRLKLVRIE